MKFLQTPRSQKTDDDGAVIIAMTYADVDLISRLLNSYSATLNRDYEDRRLNVSGDEFVATDDLAEFFNQASR